MAQVLDLKNAELWESLYVDGVRRVTRVGNGWVPIPPFELPLLISHHVLMVSAESQLAKAEWWLGIRLTMLIDAPGTDFDVIPAFNVNIPVNRPYLAKFERLSDTFRLRVEVPPWHEEISVRLWQYTGSSSDSTEDLILSSVASLESDLTRIEAKIDSLG